MIFVRPSSFLLPLSSSLFLIPRSRGDGSPLLLGGVDVDCLLSKLSSLTARSKGATVAALATPLLAAALKLALDATADVPDKITPPLNKLVDVLNQHSKPEAEEQFRIHAAQAVVIIGKSIT